MKQEISGPRALYHQRVANGDVGADAAQEKALGAFENLYRDILRRGPLPEEKRPSLLGRLMGVRPRPAEAPRGLYLYGSVGRGKSMLMDLFHGSLPTGYSRRLHFHQFMREAHATLHAWRSHPTADAPAQGDPIHALARSLTQMRRVLCLDEMDIQDIGDAMIIGRLFQAITDLGVVVVTTSNRAPDELYKDGLQREKFLTFIDLMKARLTIFELDSPCDHRLDHLNGLKVYISPGGPQADRKLDAFMAGLAGVERPAPTSIQVDGRTLEIPLACSRVARFRFHDLCAVALGSHDYLALAERFDALIVSDIPRLGPANRDEARRFVVLVDALYENRAVLICSAAAPPQDLYVEGEGAFEFHRTVSRLLEMQTDAYLIHARCTGCMEEG